MADFYGTEVDADDYHTARGNAAWATGTGPDKLAALIRASQYIDGLGQRDGLSLFPGTKTDGRAQVLAWPRTGAADWSGAAILPDEIPVEVQFATYEAALRELTAPGSLRPDYVPGQQIKREKVDVLETEYVAPAEGVNPVRPVVSVVMDMLAPVMMLAIGPSIYAV